MKNAATKVKSITEAREEAKKFLRYVYVGNVEGIDNNTYCPNCNELLVKRNGYDTDVIMKKRICEKCKEEINIIL